MRRQRRMRKSRNRWSAASAQTSCTSNRSRRRLRAQPSSAICGSPPTSSLALASIARRVARGDYRVLISPVAFCLVRSQGRQCRAVHALILWRLPQQLVTLPLTPSSLAPHAPSKSTLVRPYRVGVGVQGEDAQRREMPAVPWSDRVSRAESPARVHGRGIPREAPAPPPHVRPLRNVLLACARAVA